VTNTTGSIKLVNLTDRQRQIQTDRKREIQTDRKSKAGLVLIRAPGRIKLGKVRFKLI
jgi:hypothetical protein